MNKEKVLDLLKQVEAEVGGKELESGKWRYESGLDIFSTGYNIFDHDGRFVCAVSKEKYACKIAALPDLLEAAEAIDELYTKGCIGCSLDANHRAIHKIRKAVAKAKGADNE